MNARKMLLPAFERLVGKRNVLNEFSFRAAHETDLGILCSSLHEPQIGKPCSPSNEGLQRGHVPQVRPYSAKNVPYVRTTKRVPCVCLEIMIRDYGIASQYRRVPASRTCKRPFRRIQRLGLTWVDASFGFEGLGFRKRRL